MKQTELAKELGISKSYLSMILSGKRIPNTELAKAISSQNVHKSETDSTCKGGALPTELQPHSQEYYSNKQYHAQFTALFGQNIILIVKTHHPPKSYTVELSHSIIFRYQ